MKRKYYKGVSVERKRVGSRSGKKKAELEVGEHITNLTSSSAFSAANCLDLSSARARASIDRCTCSCKS